MRAVTTLLHVLGYTCSAFQDVFLSRRGLKWSTVWPNRQEEKCTHTINADVSRHFALFVTFTSLNIVDAHAGFFDRSDQRDTGSDGSIVFSRTRYSCSTCNGFCSARHIGIFACLACTRGHWYRSNCWDHSACVHCTIFQGNTSPTYSGILRHIVSSVYISATAEESK